MGMQHYNLIPLHCCSHCEHVALHPERKFEHFRKNWDDGLFEEAKATVQEKVRIYSTWD